MHVGSLYTTTFLSAFHMGTPSSTLRGCDNSLWELAAPSPEWGSQIYQVRADYRCWAKMNASCLREQLGHGAQRQYLCSSVVSPYPVLGIGMGQR